MEKNSSKTLVTIIISVLLSVAVSVGLTVVLIQNSSLVLKAIETNAQGFAKFIFSEKMRNAMSSQQQIAQKEEMEKRVQKEKDKLEQDFKNPRNPKIDPSRAIFGPKNAPITIVEYSDFQCTFCARAYQTIKKIKKVYGNKVRVLYKHLPNQRYGRKVAEYYEAVALQGSDKAEKFHDYVFDNSNSLRNPNKSREDVIKFLNSAVKKVRANLAKAKKDMKSKKIADIINEDKKEANGFGFNGTPAFIINGVRLSGARPIDSFKEIIDRHLNKS